MEKMEKNVNASNLKYFANCVKSTINDRINSLDYNENYIYTNLGGQDGYVRTVGQTDGKISVVYDKTLSGLTTLKVSSGGDYSKGGGLQVQGDGVELAASNDGYQWQKISLKDNQVNLKNEYPSFGSNSEVEILSDPSKSEISLKSYKSNSDYTQVEGEKATGFNTIDLTTNGSMSKISITSSHKKAQTVGGDASIELITKPETSDSSSINIQAKKTTISAGSIGKINLSQDGVQIAAKLPGTDSGNTNEIDVNYSNGITIKTNVKMGIESGDLTFKMEESQISLGDANGTLISLESHSKRDTPLVNYGALPSYSTLGDLSLICKKHLEDKIYSDDWNWVGYNYVGPSGQPLYYDIYISDSTDSTATSYLKAIIHVAVPYGHLLNHAISQKVEDGFNVDAHTNIMKSDDFYFVLRKLIAANANFCFQGMIKGDLITGTSLGGGIVFWFSGAWISNFYSSFPGYGRVEPYQQSGCYFDDNDGDSFFRTSITSLYNGDSFIYDIGGDYSSKIKYTNTMMTVRQRVPTAS